MTTRRTDPLLERARERPDAPALVDDAGEVSYAGLAGAAMALAGRLADAGVVAGDRVGLIAGPGREAVTAVHAIRLAGGVLVGLDPRAPLEALRPLAARAGIRVLVHDAAGADAAGADAAGALGVAAIRAAAEDHAVDAGDAGDVRLDPAAPGAILFTSGTTGEPKAAVLTYGALLASAAVWNEVLDARPADRWLLALPIVHVAGLGIVLRAAVAGASVLVQPRFDPAAVRAALADGGVTLVSLVPAQLARLLDERPLPLAAPRLRAVLLGGAPIPPDLVRRAVDAGLPVRPTYGLTEAASGVTVLALEDAATRSASAGTVLPGMAVRVADDRGRDVPPGAEGSILVAGPALFAGYDGDPGATAAALRDGWLVTGDVGTLDDAGRLTVLDRRDDLIVSGGENVYPAEVEAVLRAHPAVTDVAVVGRADARWGAVPVAAVVLRERDPLLAPVDADAALRAFARDRLPPFKVPAEIVPVGIIPRTGSGKVVRREVAALLARAPRLVRHDRPDGARIVLRCRGGGPPLLLLHATLSTATDLDPLAELLAERWTVLAMDRRSAGASSMPPDDVPAPVDVATHVDDAAAVLEARGDGPAVVVGHSYGAVLALELAARRPDLVAACWLWEPPYVPVGPDEVRAGFRGVGERILRIARADGLEAAALAFVDVVSGTGAAGRLPERTRDAVAREGRGAVADAALAGLDPDGLARIVAPVVVATGGRSAPFYETIATALAGRIRDLRVVRFDRLGHHGPITHPRIVAEAILADPTLAGRVHAGPTPSTAGAPA